MKLLRGGRWQASTAWVRRSMKLATLRLSSLHCIGAGCARKMMLGMKLVTLCFSSLHCIGAGRAPHSIAMEDGGGKAAQTLCGSDVPDRKKSESVGTATDKGSKGQIGDAAHEEAMIMKGVNEHKRSKSQTGDAAQKEAMVKLHRQRGHSKCAQRWCLALVPK
eukprot:1148648-Pelagomonas_calceolata.AAC.6